LGAWAAEVRYRAACTRNIPQGAAIEREADHSRISFFKISFGARRNDPAVAGYLIRDTIQRSRLEKKDRIVTCITLVFLRV
jgi:hypothetical protein